LNQTAALLWECFDGVSSVAAICADVADGLGAPYDVVFTDTVAVITDLVDEGFVHDARDAPPERDAAERHGPDPFIPRPDRLLAEPPGG
jgi:hypothetical protein